MRSATERLDALHQAYGSSVVRAADQDWRVIDTGGSSEPVLLLPGVQGGGEVFVEPILRLGARHRLLAVTYPALADVEALAAGLVALLDRLDLYRMVFVGASLGGFVAQYVAASSPGRIAALFLGNTFINIDPVRHLPAHDPVAIAASSPESFLAGRRGRLTQMPAGPVRALLDRLLQPDAAAGLRANALAVARSGTAPKVDLPEKCVVLLSCDDDAIVTEPMRAALAARYSGSRHVRLSVGGHNPHIAVADAYCEALEAFLDDSGRCRTVV